MQQLRVIKARHGNGLTGARREDGKSTLKS